MDKKDWYYLQSVTEAEMDSAFDQVEEADRAISKTNTLVGLTAPITPTPVSSAISITVPAFTAFDKQGKRIPTAAPIVQLLTTATGGGATAPSAGNRRWVSVFAKFGYALSDARTDGFSATVQFQKTEALSEDGTNTGVGKFYRVAGTQDLVGNALPPKPALDANAILICDVLYTDGATQFITSDIDTSRQELTIIERLKDPTATALDMTTPIATFKNVQKHIVSGVDHAGFPAGRYVHFEENWLDVNAVEKTATGSGGWFGAWNYRINNGGGIAGHIYGNGAWVADTTTHPPGGIVGVNAFGQSVNAATVVEMAHPIWRTPTNGSLVYETVFSLNDGGGSGVPLPNSSWAVGIGPGSFVSGNSVDVINAGGAAPLGCYICRDPLDGPGFWKFVVRTPGGFTTGVISAFAVTNNVSHRYRIEFIEAGQSNDGRPHIRQYIDGAVQLDSIATMAGLNVTPFIRASGSQGEVMIFNQGPLRLFARGNDLGL